MLKNTGSTDCQSAAANRKLAVRESPVHGRGVFATGPIPAGKRIIEYTGVRIRWDSVADDPLDARTYYFGIEDGSVVIDPSVGGNEARWINHSCEPNCEAIEEEDGRVFIYALRDIGAGEELSYDYRLEVDEPRTKEVEAESECFCGSPKCRGTMLQPV
jgi:SET domain-containing protein